MPRKKKKEPNHDIFYRINLSWLLFQAAFYSLKDLFFPKKRSIKAPGRAFAYLLKRYR